MKIIFGELELNAGAQPPKSMRVDAKNQVSADFAIDNQNAILRQNKNLKTAVAFEIENAHATESSALKFALSQAKNMNGVPAEKLVFFDEEEGAKIFELGNAALVSLKISCFGHSTNSKYEFYGDAE